MKKILTISLTMAMIAGCVQAPSKAKHEYVKKIDDTKDWVYYEDENDEKYYDYSEATLEEWLYVYCERDKQGYPIFLNIDSEDADEYNNPSPPLDKDGNPVTKSGVYNWRVYAGAFTWQVSEKYISILSKSLSGGYYLWGTRTFSLLDGREITNSELLENFGLTMESASKIAEAEVIKRGCISDSTVEYECLYDTEKIAIPLNDNYSVSLDDGSLLFVDENNHLNVILNLKVSGQGQNPDLKIIINLSE